jgi:hypothetical protein
MPARKFTVLLKSHVALGLTVLRGEVTAPNSPYWSVKVTLDQVPTDPGPVSATVQFLSLEGEQWAVGQPECWLTIGTKVVGTFSIGALETPKSPVY